MIGFGSCCQKCVSVMTFYLFRLVQLAEQLEMESRCLKKWQSLTDRGVALYRLYGSEDF
jgi:hypothetical protein